MNLSEISFFIIIENNWLSYMPFLISFFLIFSLNGVNLASHHFFFFPDQEVLSTQLSVYRLNEYVRKERKEDQSHNGRQLHLSFVQLLTKH